MFTNLYATSTTSTTTKVEVSDTSNPLAITFLKQCRHAQMPFAQYKAEANKKGIESLNHRMFTAPMHIIAVAERAVRTYKINSYQ